MKKARKALLTLCAALLLVTMTVGVTVAYLTATTGFVKNTFTVGNVKIGLDEAKVDVYGEEAATAGRTTENTYKLIPGHHYTKDPTVYVKGGSEPCYVFIKVVNSISDIEATYTYKDEEGKDVTVPVIAEQMEKNGWKPLEKNENIYYYEKIVESATTDQPFVVFESFTIKGDADVSTFNGKTVTIDAYAIQADGFDTPELAWAANTPEWEN